MKYLTFSFLLILFGQAMAQDNLLMTESVYSSIHGVIPSNELLTLKRDFMDYTKGSKLLAVNTYDSNFQRAYLINKDGETISSGYMPSTYFLPNDNFIVISGKNTKNKDSFNPYGATDVAFAIVFGTINNFISRLKKNRQ
ncbi:MAG: hypothetical protein KAQ79_04810 [Cyclobacteriaceae bacterium]|nr:hypothetical protein [Cyclobacteriaceae bacterium]